MPFKIVRNDIVNMEVDAIVNTANDHPTVGTGCDYAVYKAAGYEQLLECRKKIGYVKEGEAFLTPGFRLPAKYIIHAVSPLYRGGFLGEERKLRSCYRNSLRIAAENQIRSIAFPLISTGGFGYPKEEGMRIAVDEIHSFLLHQEMMIYLVVFDGKATGLGKQICPDLESYIDRNYVQKKREEEYAYPSFQGNMYPAARQRAARAAEVESGGLIRESVDEYTFSEAHESALEERMKHLTDTFSQYLLYLIKSKGMTNAEVYKRAIVDKKTFSKIKNNPNAHPQKMTAMCLCIGAKLNMDETRDLLARAGYALSPCDKTDVIFSYFIENQIYDMIELDIQLEEHGLPCLIS